MVISITWNVQADSGGSWTGQEQANAVDRIGVTLQPNESDTLALQPSGPEAIRFVVISADTYDGVTFALNGHPAVTLTAPAVFNTSAIRLLETEAPMTLAVVNTGPGAVTVDVAIFRDP
jgi:hypothetical protein